MSVVAENPRVPQVLRDYIVENFMPGEGLETLRYDDLLLEGGIIDSASVMTLIMFMEERFGIRINDEELLAENFASVARMAALVESKLLRGP